MVELVTQVNGIDVICAEVRRHLISALGDSPHSKSENMMICRMDQYLHLFRNVSMRTKNTMVNKRTAAINTAKRNSHPASVSLSSEDALSSSPSPPIL